MRESGSAKTLTITVSDSSIHYTDNGCTIAKHGVQGF